MIIKVRIWSVLLNKEVIHTFRNYKDAERFALYYNGIIVA